MKKDLFTLIDEIKTFMVINNVPEVDMNISSDSGIIKRVSLSYSSHSYYWPTISIVVIRHDEYYCFEIIYLTLEDIKEIYRSIIPEKN